MLKLGGKSIKSLFYGDKVISKAYYGDNLIFKTKHYTDLEYLQSTGTQFIDTGVPFYVVKDFKITATVVNLDNNRKVIAGDYFNDGNVSISFEFGGTSNNKPAYLRGFLEWRENDGYASLWSSTALPLNTELSLVYEWKASEKKMYITYQGTTQSLHKSSSQLYTDTEKTIKLFLDNRGSVSNLANPLRICKLSMEVDNVLVRDYVARLDANNVACMYDKVSEQYFYNKGTGEFLYGKVV